MIPVARWLEQSAAGMLVRESLWGFQIVVAIHIVGLAFSVGLLIWFDLRLLGMGVVNSRVSAVYRRLATWSSPAFVSMFVSGGLLFTGFAHTALTNPFFRIKMVTLGLAATNALVYHLVTERGIAQWDHDLAPPWPARLAGLLSLICWAVVILCGRMMSYTMF